MAFAGVVLVGTLKGIIMAIIVSLVTLACHIADPPVYVLRRKPGTNVFRPQSTEHPEDESFPGLLLLRPEGPIFFANAAQIAHKIEPLITEAQPRIVAVDASGVLDLEYTALKMFAQVAERQSQHGIQLWLIGMNPEVLAVVQRSPLGQMLQRGGMHFNLEIAISSFLATAGNGSRSYPAFELRQCCSVDVALNPRISISRMTVGSLCFFRNAMGACTRAFALADVFWPGPHPPAPVPEASHQGLSPSAESAVIGHWIYCPVNALLRLDRSTTGIGTTLLSTFSVAPIYDSRPAHSGHSRMLYIPGNR